MTRRDVEGEQTIQARNYRAFLLRLWRDDDDGPWRSMLEESDTGNQTVFADTQSLCCFLRAATGERSPEEDGENDP